MSLSHFRHKFDACDHPVPEPEVRRAILASWTSKPSTAPNARNASQSAGFIAANDLFDAPRAMDDGSASHGK